MRRGSVAASPSPVPPLTVPQQCPPAAAPPPRLATAQATVLQQSRQRSCNYPAIIIQTSPTYRPHASSMFPNHCPTTAPPMSHLCPTDVPPMSHQRPRLGGLSASLMARRPPKSYVLEIKFEGVCSYANQLLIPPLIILEDVHRLPPASKLSRSS